MREFPEEPLWQSIKKHIDMNMDLMDVIIHDGSIQYSFDNPAYPDGRSIASARIREYTTTLGIDVQGYSGKGLHEQFLTSVKLFAFIEKTIAWFHRHAPHASCRPDAIIPTGDGALLFFGESVMSFSRALNFAIVLNMHIQATNEEYPLIGATYDGLNIPTRFSIAMGNSIMMRDPNGNVNVVGESIIRCARLLSCDKKIHFLLDCVAANNLVQNFGSIGAGIGACTNILLENIETTISDRITKTIKGVAYGFHNITLTHDIMALKDDLQEERRRVGDSHPFTVGTKDLAGIEKDGV